MQAVWFKHLAETANARSLSCALTTYPLIPTLISGMFLYSVLLPEVKTKSNTGHISLQFVSKQHLAILCGVLYDFQTEDTLHKTVNSVDVCTHLTEKLYVKKQESR